MRVLIHKRAPMLRRMVHGVFAVESFFSLFSSPELFLFYKGCDVSCLERFCKLKSILLIQVTGKE